MNKNALPGFKKKRYQQKKDIIKDFYRLGILSKPEVCRLTNMTMPTISKIVDELVEEGWVVNRGQGPSIGGKRPHIYSLNPDVAYIIGIDLGRETLKIAIFNLHKEVIGSIQQFPSILESQDNEAILSDLRLKIEKSLIDLKIPRNKLKVAGVSIPGLLDNSGNSYTYLALRKAISASGWKPCWAYRCSWTMIRASWRWRSILSAPRASPCTLCASVSMSASGWG